MSESSHHDRPHVTPAQHSPGNESGYERSDTRGRAIFLGLLFSALAIVAITFLLNEFFVMTQESITHEQVASRVDPKLAEIRAQNTRNLTTYEWVDSTQGIVRIPIDRAMELMVEEAYQERVRAAR